jgi:hypothetical protein
MGDLTRVVSDVLMLLIRMGTAILSAVEAIEMSMREQLAVMGVSPLTQTLILVVLAFAIILLALRVFGGLLRLAVIVVLVLIALQVMMPALMMPTH